MPLPYLILCCAGLYEPLVPIGDSDDMNSTADPDGAATAPAGLLDFAAAYDVSDAGATVKLSAAKRRLMARNRWALAYTLLNNPVLRVDRRSHQTGFSRWYTVPAVQATATMSQA